MITTILFDLDNTLLGNDMNTFLPRYFALLNRYIQAEFNQRNMLPAILAASREMELNNEPQLTNREVFWQCFRQHFDLDMSELERKFGRFYDTEFKSLEPITNHWPAAEGMVRTSFARGLKVVFATNPMFPLPAVETRLAWASVPSSDFAYDLITTYENMHAVKPHLAYYQEILDKVGCKAENALMVGDDWQRDIEPASALGLFTYWIQLPGTKPRDPTLPTGYGSPDTLLARLQSGWLQGVAAVGS